MASFDAQVYIQMWLGVEQDEAQFENNAQAAFELGLRRDGVTIDGASPNLLFCSLRVAERLGQIAYTFSVEYFEPAAAGVRRLAWTMGGMVMGGTGAFSAEGAAKNCVDTFSNEWLKQNPRREEEGR